MADKINESFHFIIYGLDADRFSTTDLIEEIYQEFKNSFGKMNKEDISCKNCEAEFYIETFTEILFCPHCGHELDLIDEDDLMFADDILELDFDE